MSLKERPCDAAERLAEQTGKPIEEFEPDFDTNQLPDYSEQEYEELSADESPFSDA